MTNRNLQARNAELRRLLEEAQDTILAIKSGAVDALVIDQPAGPRVYTLQAVDRPYRLFVEQMQQGAATLHEDGTIVFCNSRLEELLKARAGDLIGVALHQFIVAEDRSRYEMLWPCRSESAETELRLRRADGELVPAFVTFNALPEDCGASVGVLITDLTAQKHQEQLNAAHEMRRISEERLRLAIEATGVGIFDLDPVTGHQSFSDEAMRLWSFEPGSVPSTWRVLNAVHPDDREFVQSISQASLAPSGTGQFAIEHRIILADESVRWVATSARTVFSSGVGGRRAIRSLGTMLDITERKQIERELLASEECFRLSLQGSRVIIAKCDPDLRYIWVHDPAPDFEQLAVIGKRDTEIADNEGTRGLERLKRTVIETRAGATSEITFPLKDGPVTYEIRAEPRFDASGSLEAVVTVGLDVSERKQAEERMRDADRHKNEFLAMLAHELRNPLAPIRNALHVLGMDGTRTPATDRMLKIMERQTTHMTRLVDDLLEVARITSGKIELKKERVDLAALAALAAETARPLIDARQHRLDVSLPDVQLWIEADPIRISQALTNLLDNAAKYMDTNGHIHLQMHQQGDEAVVRVRDQGIGIAPDMLPRVFDLFSQAQGNVGRAQGGLGIGLALVQGLVEMHGGKVEAHSEGAGGGSEFVIRLPLAAASVVSAESTSPSPMSAFPRRVLIVDDNRDAADTLGMLLGALDAEVRVVYEGSAAVNAFAAFQPDVALLDLGMPGMDGFETARRLREASDGRRLTLVAVTGWGRDEDRLRTRNAGFDHHLVKPIDFDLLEGILSGLSPAEVDASGVRAAEHAAMHE